MIDLNSNFFDTKVLIVVSSDDSNESTDQRSKFQRQPLKDKDSLSTSGKAPIMGIKNEKMTQNLLDLKDRRNKNL